MPQLISTQPVRPNVTANPIPHKSTPTNCHNTQANPNPPNSFPKSPIDTQLLPAGPTPPNLPISSASNLEAHQPSLLPTSPLQPPNTNPATSKKTQPSHTQTVPSAAPSHHQATSNPPPPNPSPDLLPICPLCFVQGHTAVVCPTGQREAVPNQANPRPTSIHGCTPPVRQNASKESSSTTVHQQASSSQHHTSPTPPPPPPQPNPDPPPNPNASPEESSSPSIAIPSKHKQAHQPPVHLPESSPKHLRPLALDIHHVSASQQHSSPMAAPPPPQSNLEANQNFWEAMNRQVALLEQARLKAPTVDAGNNSIPNLSLENQTQPVLQEASRTGTFAVDSPSVCHNAEPNSANNVNLVEDRQIDLSKEPPNPAAKPIKLKQPDVDQSPSLNQQQQDALERFKKKVRAQTQSQGQQPIGSTSAYPFEALVEDQSDEEDDDYTAATFNSDTDDGFVEPIDMGYQSADGRSSHIHTKSSAPVMKTNKRHPNIPLNVRLRARKNSYSSSHKYLCM